MLGEEDATVKANGEQKGNNKTKQTKKKFDSEWNKKIIKSNGKNTKELEKIKVAIIDFGIDEFNDIDVKMNVNFIPGEEEVLPLFWDTKGHG